MCDYMLIIWTCVYTCRLITDLLLLFYPYNKLQEGAALWKGFKVSKSNEDTIIIYLKIYNFKTD